MPSLSQQKDQRRPTHTIPAARSLEEESGECEDGWTAFQDQCFFFPNATTDRGKTYDDCQTHCDSLGATMPCIYNAAMNEFVAQFVEFGSDNNNRVWIGMREVNGFFRWQDPRCAAAEQGGEYFFRADQPNNVLSRRSECIEIQKGVNVVNPPPFFIAEWNDVSCRAERQCVCQKPHPTVIVPRGPCVDHPDWCFPQVSTTTDSDLDECSARQVAERPFENAACWGRAPHTFQMDQEYYMGDDDVEGNNYLQLPVLDTLEAHEDVALSFNGHVASVHSMEENELLTAVGAYQDKIFFRIDEPSMVAAEEPMAMLMTQTECEHACYQHSAQQPCISSQEENDFLVSLFGSQGPMWVGYTDQNFEGAFRWTNAACFSDFTNWPNGNSFPMDNRDAVDCAAIEMDEETTVSFWNVTECNKPLQCVCQIDRPCARSTEDDEANPSMLLGAKRVGDRLDDFEWLDETIFGDYTNWATTSTPPEPNNEGGVEDRIELRSPSGLWYDVALPSTNNDTSIAVCAPYKRPKQYLDMAIETSSSVTDIKFRFVPGVVPVQTGKGLQTLYPRRLSRQPGKYFVLSNNALLVYGSQSNILYNLQPLQPILDHGFALQLSLKYFPILTLDGIDCLTKVCFLGTCQAMPRQQTTISIDSSGSSTTTGGDSDYPLLAIEQYCSTVEWGSLDSVTGFTDFSLSFHGCPENSSTISPSETVIIPTCECNEGFVSSDNGLSNQVNIDGTCSQIEPSSFSTQARANTSAGFPSHLPLTLTPSTILGVIANLCLLVSGIVGV